MFIIFIFLTLETKVDTFLITIPPQSQVSIQQDTLPDYILPNVMKRIPEFIRRPLKENLSEINKEQIRIRGAKKIDYEDITGNGKKDLIVLKQDTLFLLKGSQFSKRDVLLTGIYSFSASKGKIAYSDTFGKIYILNNGKKKFIFDTGSPVNLAYNGRNIYYSKSNEIFSIKSGYFGYKHTRIKRLKGIPFFANGKIYSLYKRVIYPIKQEIPFDITPECADVDNDGKDDIIYTDEKGNIWWNRCKNGEWAFLNEETKILFPKDFPTGAKISLMSKDSLLSGTYDGKLILYVKNNEVWHKKWEKDAEKYFSPIIYDWNKDGERDLIAGTKDGRVLLFSNMEIDKTPMVIDTVSSFASPAIWNGKIVIGRGNGTIKGFNQDWKCSGPAKIASGDLNLDGKDDIIAGSGNGKIYIFLSPTYTPDSTIIPASGKFITPSIFDVNGDKKMDIILTNLNGKCFYFENTSTQDKFSIQEKYSFAFKDDKSRIVLYDKYLPPGNPVYKKDINVMHKIEDLLKNTPDKYLDEVSFALAYTPEEIVRAMAKMNELDIFLENARNIYKSADTLKYVNIVEKNGWTTLKYDGKYELPRDIYYFYVVHPRILYEIPARINADYWKNPPAYYGISEDKWLKKKIDVYHKPNGSFWRTTLWNDNYFGKPLKEVLQGKTTLKEAILALHKWYSWAYKGNKMRFGYKTQDLQPLVIFYKAYGSCGEQSILLAAISRTALIPNYVVIDRGEDHQWNQFWYPKDWKTEETHNDKLQHWHHWDINGKTEDHIDNPVVSSEGMKKDVSAVVGWRGDGYQFPVTEIGYTPTGVLNVKVSDNEGNSIDGALVILRSHWRDRNSIAIWNYTNSDGNVAFHLGYEPKGYTIEALTPYGAAGNSHLMVYEGDTENVVLSVPYGRAIKKITPIQDTSIEIQIRDAYILPRNLITSHPYRISNAYIRDTINYQGVRDVKWELPPINDIKIVKKGKDEFLYNPDERIYKNVMVIKKSAVPSAPPTIQVSPAFAKVKMGEKTEFKIKMKDNLGIKEAYCTTPKGKVKINNGKFLLDTGKGGPMFPSNYTLKFFCKDYAENADSSIVNMKILPAMEFKHQVVFQDNPEDTLPNASWIYGPIRIDKKIPFLFIKTSPDESEGLDLDLFLYRDKNGDGKPEKKEKVASSTSPYVTETIYVSNPDTGTYWIYAQGCTVEQDSAYFDIQTSFETDENGRIK